MLQSIIACGITCYGGNTLGVMGISDKIIHKTGETIETNQRKVSEFQVK